MKAMAAGSSGFTLVELLVVVAIIAILMALLLPALMLAREKAREAACIANIKHIGTALALWYDNADRYPAWGHAYTPLTGHPNLGPWPDALALRSPEWDPDVFTNENLENARAWFDLHPEHGEVEHYIRCVDSVEIFRCPSDRPHPHRINIDRAQSWNFWREAERDGYEHSYGIGVGVSKNGCGGHEKDDGSWGGPTFHRNASAQILAADAVWNWIQNFSAGYIDDPNSGFNTNGWWCNCIGYFHGNATRANVVCRDGSARGISYREMTSESNVKRVFFWGSRETPWVFH
jgi:prepilin-type N-terminal cleavage/methylation domain-containing protein